MNYTKGPLLILFPQNYFDDNEKDSFVLSTALNRHILRGTTSGELTWKNNSLSDVAIVAKSITNNGYIKIACGLILQWGSTNVLSSYYSLQIFPILFSSASSYQVIVSAVGNGVGNKAFTACITGFDSIQFYVSVNDNSAKANWFAIGY